MKPSTKIILPSALALGFLLTACDNDKFAEELRVVKDNVSFALDIQPILSGQCAGCHNPANVNPDLRKGFAYSSLTDIERWQPCMGKGQQQIGVLRERQRAHPLC